MVSVRDRINWCLPAGSMACGTLMPSLVILAEPSNLRVMSRRNAPYSALKVSGLGSAGKGAANRKSIRVGTETGRLTSGASNSILGPEVVALVLGINRPPASSEARDSASYTSKRGDPAQALASIRANKKGMAIFFMVDPG